MNDISTLLRTIDYDDFLLLFKQWINTDNPQDQDYINLYLQLAKHQNMHTNLVGSCLTPNIQFECARKLLHENEKEAFREVCSNASWLKEFTKRQTIYLEACTENKLWAFDVLFDVAHEQDVTILESVASQMAYEDNFASFLHITKLLEEKSQYRVLMDCVEYEQERFVQELLPQTKEHLCLDNSMALQWAAKNLNLSLVELLLPYSNAEEALSHMKKVKSFFPQKSIDLLENILTKKALEQALEGKAHQRSQASKQVKKM